MDRRGHQLALEEATAWMKNAESYIHLLQAELDETVYYAATHGWKSSRYEIGVILRSLLGIEGRGDRPQPSTASTDSTKSGAGNGT